MERYQFWLLIGLVVVFGGALEYIKSPTMKKNAWNHSQSPMAIDESGAGENPETNSVMESPETAPMPVQKIAALRPRSIQPAPIDAAVPNNEAEAAPVVENKPEEAKPADGTEGKNEDGTDKKDVSEADLDENDGKKEKTEGDETVAENNDGKEKTAEEKAKEKSEKDKKKKKKKAVAKEEKKAEEKPEEKVADADAEKKEAEIAAELEEEKNKAAAAAANNAAPPPIYGIAVPRTAAKTPAAIPQTTKEWLELIIKEADFKEVSRLVQYYQSGLVTEKVFYEVVRAMMDHDNHQIHELGVVALSSTPSLPSFSELNRFLEQEKGASNAKRQAQGALAQYAAIQYLTVLASAIQTTGQTSLSMQGLRLLNQTAESTFKPFAPSTTATNPPTPPSDDSTNTTAAVSGLSVEQQKKFNQASRSFQPFVAILTKVSKGPQDELRQAASDSLRRLEGWLGTSPVQTQAQN